MRFLKHAIAVSVLMHCYSIFCIAGDAGGALPARADTGELSKQAFAAWDTENYTLAAKLFTEILSINMQFGNENAVKNVYTNLGLIYSDMRDYETALLNLRKSLSIRAKANEPTEMASELINISIVLQLMDRHYEAIERTYQALDFGKKANDMRLIRQCYGVLAESYDKTGDTKKSMDYFGLYASLDRHIQSKIAEDKRRADQEAAQKVIAQAKNETNIAVTQKNEKEAALQKVKINLEKNQRLTKLQEARLKLQEAEIRERDTLIKHKALLNQLYIAAICVSLLIVLLVFNLYILKKKSSEKLSAQNSEILIQQDIIERKSKNISESISYAQRIQQAMLPPVEYINSKLPDSFVFFRPRDIVSGDFYWISTDSEAASVARLMAGVRSEHFGCEGEDIFVAAADCTGHGVPGAFMSMIGHNLLTEILARGITNPRKMLEALNAGVKKSLRQEESMNSDGMDIGLCRIRKLDGCVEFSGAMSNMYYCKNGELSELEGGLFSVGGDDLELGTVNYPLYIVDIDCPTVFYMFSDGYQDQFGGPNGTKFMSSRFKQLIHKIHNLPMQQQEAELAKELDEWKNGMEQIDDILVICFKLEPQRLEPQ
jgi:tetratricopeptide (TPR) repeat protein